MKNSPAIFLVVMALLPGCAGPGASPSQSTNQAISVQQSSSPQKGDRVEFYGGWLFTELRVTPGAGYSALNIFASDRQTAATGVAHFGFYDSELPEQYSRVSVKDFKGIRGRFVGATNVTASATGGRQYVVGVVEVVEPILK